MTDEFAAGPEWPFARTVSAGRPNWVSSVAPPGTRLDASHRVEPLPLHGSPEQTAEKFAVLLETAPRTRVVEHTGRHVRAEVRSLVFRFVDDVELVATATGAHILSASRLGYSDLGVNRKRVEWYRKIWDWVEETREEPEGDEHSGSHVANDPAASPAEREPGN